MKETDIENHINNLINSIQKHDFAYEYSDDPRSWSRWRANEEYLQDQIKDIITKGVPADELYTKVINGIKEEFKDGLVHRTIGYWFKNASK